MHHLARCNLINVAALILLSIPAGTAAQTSTVAVRPQLPVVPQRKFLLTDFGALGDGKAMNTDAFLKAVAACRRAGGGEVFVPAGTFVTGPIELTDKMALVLEKGATVRGSENFKDYESTGGGKDSKAKPSILPLIRGTNLSDVEIRGEGTIDGAGLVWWQRFRAERAAGVPQQGQPRAARQPVESPRPKLILLTGCTRVRIQGVTLKDSPQFHLVPNRCREVTIEDVKIKAPADSPNTDGIDPTGSRDVLIRRCLVDVGDDNISFKSNPNEGATENVLVTGCTFRHGHGASVGSNIGGGIRNVTVEHCTFEDTDNGVRIKSARDRGGVVEHVTYRDITMKNVGVAVTINLFYFDKAGQKERQARPVNAATPVVRDVRIVNVTVDGAKTAGEIIGLPEMPVSGVLFDNVRIKAKTGLTVQDAKAVELRDVQITPQKGEPLTVREAEVKTTRGDAGEKSQQ
jgi:polygalacturonase